MSILVALALAAQAAAPATPVPSGSVVVTARRRGDAEAALAACLARQCPPDQDAAAALALAEVQFVDGDYARAQQVVEASLGRTRRHAKRFAEPVANLQRARGRLAAHQGDYARLEIAAIGAREALSDAFPDDDPRVLGATIELGDMFARVGRPEVAEQRYAAVARQAAAAGERTQQGFALLRLAQVRTVGEGPPSAGDVRRASATLAPLLAGDDPGLKRFRLPAALFIARLAERRGDAAAIDAVLKTLTPDERAAPILLSADPIDLGQTALGGVDPTNVNPADHWQANDLRRQWIDAAFWIDADGTVRDLEVMRRGKPETASWSNAILGAIRSRRYAPITGDVGAGTFRVERYTLTAGYQMLGNSRIPQREPRLRVEMLDLTAR